jgi:hypothetical protein
LYFGKLPLRLKLQFAFCQLWYPLFSLLMFVMYLLPLVALSLDSNQVGINYPDFIVRIFPVWIFVTGTVLWCSKQRWLRPREAKVLSWEGALFLFARWPWSLLGTISAVVDSLGGRTLDFRVTPKGRADARPLALRVLAPYVFLSITSALPVLLLGNIKIAVGFYAFAAANSLLYAVLLMVIIIMHRRENPGGTAMVGAGAHPASVTS